ncbi:MAG: DNA helicase, partial [Deltaproteobacteria bacterium]|nr:DNA helicase [Deltaproteobacteria bacterium]
MPNLNVADRFNAKLDKIGNIRSDGRPILGLDAKNLFEILLETSDQAFLIPAHIWTPWFSVLGSKSGFDSIEECFEDLTPHIFAAETGLSSDPPMNWRVKSLDNLTLVSNSDAHSPQKLGREANIFDTALSYSAIRNALKT